MLHKKFRSSRSTSGSQVQYGALPFRVQVGGDIDIMLITSRGTGRWIIPKGWPIKNRSAAHTARTEAYEEAGLEGDIIPKPIGKYRYLKWTAAVMIPCEVTVLALAVKVELDEWPEMNERQRRWFSRAEAAELVAEPDLKQIIMSAKPSG